MAVTQITSLSSINYTPINNIYFTNEELQARPAGSILIFDSEVFWNYFCVCFKCPETNKKVAFELSDYKDFDKDKLSWVMWHFCLVGFNSLKFDIYILMMALRDGTTTHELKQLANDIIQNDMVAFEIEKRYGFNKPKQNHIDLIEVCPLSASLKLYAGRLHCKRMQDLPFKEDVVLNQEQQKIVLDYCFKDLEDTQLIMTELSSQLDLRASMSEKYNVDLRSKSDAQIAETVISGELEKKTGQRARKPNFDEVAFKKYKFAAPNWINFDLPQTKQALAQVCAAEFGVDGGGSPRWPDGLGQRVKNSKGKLVWAIIVKIGNTKYKMGMGGLHSMEKCTTHVCGNGYILSDHDVESFYPRIIINQGLFPPNLGPKFLEIYSDIVSTRVSAKRSGDKETADSLKITINGAFGKFGSMFSKLYAPGMLLQVTISGQFTLLKLIEMFETNGIEVVSANTDGIVLKCHVTQLKLRDRIISEFEKMSKFVTEETRYLALHSRDVNNYIAVKDTFDKETNQWLNMSSGCKFKGTFSDNWTNPNIFRFHKNPERLVCIDAVSNFIQHGAPVEKTIFECQDMRRFIKVRQVKGGAKKDGVYLGKAVRWYYSTKTSTPITYVESGNKVPTTEGAMPLMEMHSLTPPADLDRSWYVREAVDMLAQIGAYKPTQSARLF